MLLESTRPLLVFVVVATAAFIGTISVDAQNATGASPLPCCAPKPGSDIVVTATKENKKGEHYNVLIAETVLIAECMNELSFDCVLPPNKTVCKPRPRKSNGRFVVVGEHRIRIHYGECSYEVVCSEGCPSEIEGTYQLEPTTTAPPAPTTPTPVVTKPGTTPVVTETKTTSPSFVTKTTSPVDTETTSPPPTKPPCKFKMPDGKKVGIPDGDYAVRQKPSGKCQHCQCNDSKVSCNTVLCDPIPGCIRYDGVTDSCCPGCLEFEATALPTALPTAPEEITATPTTPDPCSTVSCKDYQDCDAYEGEAYCKDTCRDNGPCDKTTETCVLTTVNCVRAPCPKVAKCNSKGQKGDMCLIDYPDGRLGMYKDGERWVKDACTQCKCNRGVVVCSKITCEVDENCEEYAKPSRGSCCAECLKYRDECSDSSTNPPTSRRSGDRWKTGPCTTCTCASGEVVCATIACSPEEGCLEYTTPAPDDCCPKCARYESEVCRLRVDGKVVTIEEGTSYRGQCKTYRCRKNKDGSGVVVKEKSNERCPKIRKKQCDGTVEVPKGKCCAECVPFPTTPVPTEPPPEGCIDEETNKTYDHGELWRPSTCVDCSCNDTVVECRYVQNVDCPQVPGCVRYADRVGNECCRKCVEFDSPTATPIPGLPCLTTSGRKASGEYWQPNNDICYSCMCDDASTSCIRLQCQPIPDCGNYGDVPEGECCPICNDYLGRSGNIIDACIFPKEEGACIGRFDRFYFDMEDFTCKPFFYSGCAGNTNNFASQAKCNAQCDHYIRKDRSCAEEPDYGSCTDDYDRSNGSFRRFYYDSESMTCKRFRYSSCGGNANNFKERRDCLDYCLPPARKNESNDYVCRQQKMSGRCKGNFPRYYYGRRVNECRQFTYGGCGGNENNFLTLADCQGFCMGVNISASEFPPTPAPVSGGNVVKIPTEMTELPPDLLCTFPKDVGPCKNTVPRYYFNFDVKRCESFNYGGCKGNANRFTSLAECQSTCPKLLYPMEACELPVAKGPCKASFKRYYYDSASKQCQKFAYGGCLGNANNFLDLPSCLRHCAGGLTSCFQRQEEDFLNCNEENCFVTQCTETGNFEPKQCNSLEFCWCLKADGRVERNSRTPPHQAKILRCGLDWTKLTGCFKKQQKQLRKCDDADPKCTVSLSRCKPDGTYAPQQCNDAKNKCYCVYPDGTRVPNTNHKKGSNPNPCISIKRPEPKPDYPTTPAPTSTQPEATTPVFQTTSIPTTEPLATTEPVTPTTVKPTTEAPTTEPVCNGELCRYGTCVRGKCECGRRCSKVRQRVCGTNGQTYRNPCELRRTACLQMRDIKLDYPGRCGMRKLPPTSQDRCSLAPDPGPCRGYFPRFFFNSTSKRCERFIYGGCGGNENNLETIAECQRTCGGACHCPFDGAEKGFLYEGESGMSTVVASSSVVKTCRWVVVFFTERNVDVDNLRAVAKDVDAKAREECDRPVVQFGWARLDFDTPAYEVMQIGEGTTGDYGDFRLATKKPVVLSTGLGFVGASLDLFNLPSDCDSTRRFVLVADQFWKSESSLGGNVLEDMLAKAKAVLYSFVPQTDGNELASVATKSWPFEDFDKKRSRRELCDIIAAPPPARGCHRCTCDGCTLQCCRVYDRDEDSCRAGCRYPFVHGAATVAFAVPPDDRSVCEIVLIVEESARAASAVAWVQSDAMCRAVDEIRRRRSACRGDVRIGLYRFGTERGCGSVVDIDGRHFGSCAAVRRVATEMLQSNASEIEGDVYCSITNTLRQYTWIHESHKVIVVASPSPRRPVSGGRLAGVHVADFLRRSGVTLIAVVNATFASRDYNVLGLESANAYVVDESSASGYRKVDGRGTIADLVEGPGSELATIAYNSGQGNGHGTAWSYEFFTKSPSVFTSAFQHDIANVLEEVGSKCMECRCDRLGGTTCVVLDQSRCQRR